MLICVMASLEPSAQPSSSTERYLPGPLRIRRALDVVDIQNQGSQGGTQPAEPQQDHHHHPGPSQPSLRPPRSWAALNPRWSFCQNGNSASHLELLFLKEKQILIGGRCVKSDERGLTGGFPLKLFIDVPPPFSPPPSSFISFLLSPHRLQQIPSNLFDQ